MNIEWDVEKPKSKWQRIGQFLAIVITKILERFVASKKSGK